MIRTGYVVAFAAVVITVGVACSSSDDSGSSGGTGTTTTTTKLPDGGTETTTTTNGFKQCSTDTTTTTSTCKQSDLDTYNSCVLNACDSQYQTCFGSGYKSGSFSGACGSYIACIQKCDCNDLTCYQACGSPDSACQTCEESLTTCSKSCTLPACETATVPDAGGTGTTGTPTVASCVKLAACCTKIAAGAEQDACNQTADSNFDSTCTQAYSAYAGQAQSGQTCD